MVKIKNEAMISWLQCILQYLKVTLLTTINKYFSSKSFGRFILDSDSDSDSDPDIVMYRMSQNVIDRIELN